MTMPFKSLPGESSQSTVFKRGIQKSWYWLLLLAGLALAWHALRGAPLAEAWRLLAGIDPCGLLILLALNVLMLPLMAARWWQLLRIMGSPVGLLCACAYRFAANAVSYLTPGPHFGGEPLLVYLLHQRQGIPLAVATTSVTLDRLLELLASIVVLSLVLIMLTTSDSGLFTGGWPLSVVLALFIVLATFLTALFTGRRPVSRSIIWFKQCAPRRFAQPSQSNGPLVDAIIQGESIAASLLQQHCRQFFCANLFSLGHWLGVFAEFWLMSAFMGHPLSLYHLAAVVVVARLAFLTPLPAGIGALESALPWVTDTLGLGSALGLSICLIIRFRDIFFNLAGLALTMKYLTCPGKASTVAKSAG